jgi:hypothetical protein
VGPSPKFHDDRGILLKLAAEGSKVCNRKVEVRRNATKVGGRAYGAEEAVART